MSNLTIEILLEKDLGRLSELHRECFPRDSKDTEESLTWLKSNFNASPRFQYYVAKQEEKIVGYILWIELGGFREEAVLELEQIGVSSDHRGKGVGTFLIKESLKDYKKRILGPQGRKLKLIKITTGTENEAQGLYKKTLGAEPECIMKDFFSSDELIMLARFE
jgi:ribosomal protein S18 acetylase RimI-like enzyme